MPQEPSIWLFLRVGGDDGRGWMREIFFDSDEPLIATIMAA
jgi:hypothetical protein